MRRRFTASLALLIAGAALAAALGASAAVLEHRDAVVAPGPGQRRRRAGRSPPGRRRGKPGDPERRRHQRRVPSGAGHTRVGLVEGLRLGPNVIAAGGVRLVVRNYPIAGPIASGPHETPFVCTTATFKLYAALGGQAVASDETLGPSRDRTAGRRPRSPISTCRAAQLCSYRCRAPASRRPTSPRPPPRPA